MKKKKNTKKKEPSISIVLNFIDKNSPLQNIMKEFKDDFDKYMKDTGLDKKLKKVKITNKKLNES